LKGEDVEVMVGFVGWEGKMIDGDMKLELSDEHVKATRVRKLPAKRY
jgi:hypothetical protein